MQNESSGRSLDKKYRKQDGVRCGMDDPGSRSRPLKCFIVGIPVITKIYTTQQKRNTRLILRVIEKKS